MNRPIRIFTVLLSGGDVHCCRNTQTCIETSCKRGYSEIIHGIQVCHFPSDVNMTCMSLSWGNQPYLYKDTVTTFFEEGIKRVSTGG